MRTLCSALLLFATFCEAGELGVDRFYSFYETTNADTSQPYAKHAAGAMAESRFSIDDAKATVSVAAKSNLLEGVPKNEVFVREAYAKKSFLDDSLTFSVGREMRDFAAAKSYSLLQFFAPVKPPTNPDDSSLEWRGVDGGSLAYEKDFRAALYSYSKDAFSPKANGNITTVAELSKSFSRFNAAFYLVSQKEQKNIVAGSISASLNDYFNASVEFKSKEAKQDSIFSVDFTPTPHWQLTVEELNLQSKEDKHGRLVTLSRLYQLSNDEVNSYFSTLSSKNYLNGFLRYTEDDYSLLAMMLKNQTDGGERYIFQGGYKHKRLSILGTYVKNIGSALSEFGSSPQKNAISINLSYNFVR